MASIGESLAGRYRLDALIGSGGFATVFRARDMRLGRDVAVKVLLANHVTDPVVAARFEQEARVLAAVGHPNVVAIFDVAAGDPRSGSEPFLVMELCEGGSLADRLAASGNGTLLPDDLLPILIDACAGLAALHAIGIVHRDLKPSNILLSDGRARIADVGIAVAGPSDLTEVGTTIGTLAYLAPEQLAGEPATPASDVHALGIVAFVGLTGTPPRKAGSVAAVVAGSTLPVPVVSAARPGLGSAFDAAVAGALVADPSRRPTAAAFGNMLAVALERWQTEPARATSSAGAAVAVAGDEETTLVDLALPEYDDATVEPETVEPQRRPRLAWVAGISAAAIGLGLAAFLLLGGGAGGRESPSGVDAPASGSTAPPPTAAPSPAMTTAAPTPARTAASDAYTVARAASDRMRAAIADARGPGGLNGKDRKELEKGLSQFDRALEKRDANAAGDEARMLAAQVAKLRREGTVDADAGAGLATAADRLVAAANALSN